MGYTNTTPQFGLPQYAPADMPQREDFNKAFKTISENMGKGGDVQSVNGKTGVVELDADDVNAVNKAGDTMAGDLTINKGTPAIMLVGDNRKTFFKSFSTGQVQIWAGAQDDTDNISLNLEPPSRNLGITSSLRLYIDKYYNL